MAPQVVAAPGANTIVLTGHGLSISKSAALSDGIYVEPEVPSINVSDVQIGCGSDHDRFAVQMMHDLATFSIRVVEPVGGKALANKAWNSLWDFHLLSLCCGAPAFMLYAVSHGEPTAYGVVNRNLVVHPLPTIVSVSANQLAWARQNRVKFQKLIGDKRFSAAMRYFGNAHYLFDLDARIMLLWAGIEGLLDVEAEQSRRIALHSALMFDGTAVEKAAHAERVRKAYHLRSKVVHGTKPTPDKLQAGYETATDILVRLLAKCVSLGRVPTRGELDALAAGASIT